MIRKALIPVAGLGTRFLPATKAQPKEMLPIVDKPAIQYIVEEALSAGLDDILLITSSHKESIENHFDYDHGLETFLKERGKDSLLNIVDRISKMAEITSVRQKQPLGLGHAVYCGRNHIGQDPVAVFLADDIIRSDVPAIKQLMDVYEQKQCNVIAIMEVPDEDVSSYGIIKGYPDPENTDIYIVEDVVEKPALEDAPSNLAIIGRYVLVPEIFDFLRDQKPGVGNEIQLTDSIKKSINSKGVVGLKFKGDRYDTGDKLGFLKANISFALEHPEFKNDIKEYITKCVHV